MSKNLLSVGVDPSEESYEVCLYEACTDQKETKSFGIGRADRNEIAEEVIEAASGRDKERVLIYIEDGVSTAEMLLDHLTRCDWPERLRVKVALISPTTVRREAQALHIDNKTDPLDAYVAAVCCSIRTIPTVKKASYRMRKDASSYKHFIQECCRYQQKIRSLLMELNPVLANEYKSITSGKFLTVALNCFTKYRKEGAVTRIQLDGYCRDHNYRMRNGTRRKVLRLINVETIQNRLFLIDHLAELRRELVSKQKKIGKRKKQMEKRYRDHPIVKLLTTITGIAEFSASMHVGLIGDIESFEEADKLVGYIGTYPTKEESGKKEGKSSMSKKGVKVLKKLLFTSAMTGVREDKTIRKIHAKKVSQGMAKKAAYGVVMTKMVRWIYGIWSSREPWRKMAPKRRKRFERKNERFLVKLGVKLLHFPEREEEIKEELKEEETEGKIEPGDQLWKEKDTG